MESIILTKEKRMDKDHPVYTMPKITDLSKIPKEQLDGIFNPSPSKIILIPTKEVSIQDYRNKNMNKRKEFNQLKEEVLAMVGLMEALEVSGSKALESEFRRFTNKVSHRLPAVRKESIEAYKTTNDTITENTTIK